MRLPTGHGTQPQSVSAVVVRGLSVELGLLARTTGDTAIEHGIQLGLRNAEFIERCIAGIRWKLDADRQRLAAKAAEPCADPVPTIVRDDAAITRGQGLDTPGGGRTPEIGR